jgi:enoyl-CoA hydratase
MYQNIKYDLKEGLAFVTVNRPKALNALNMDVLNEMIQVFTEIEKDDQVKAVIVTGEGRSFVAGADIAQMKTLNAVEGRNMMQTGHDLMNMIESLEKPVIAAVNGFALGGGCELAMACDIRLASEKALFGQPEVGLGIIPGFGGTQRLARLIGKGMAKYLILTGENIKADEALRLGLVQKVFPPETLLEEAEKIARKIMSNAPIALASAINAINNGLDMDMKSASAYEVQSTTVCFASEDKDEGMGAFLEKRKPEFKNK